MKTVQYDETSLASINSAIDSIFVDNKKWHLKMSRLVKLEGISGLTTHTVAILKENNMVNLRQVSIKTKKNVASIKGIGPKIVTILMDEMVKHNVSFTSEKPAKKAVKKTTKKAVKKPIKKAVKKAVKKAAKY